MDDVYNIEAEALGAEAKPGIIESGVPDMQAGLGATVLAAGRDLRGCVHYH